MPMTADCQLPNFADGRWVPDGQFDCRWGRCRWIPDGLFDCRLPMGPISLRNKRVRIAFCASKAPLLRCNLNIESHPTAMQITLSKKPPRGILIKASSKLCMYIIHVCPSSSKSIFYRRISGWLLVS